MRKGRGNTLISMATWQAQTTAKYIHRISTDNTSYSKTYVELNQM